MLINADTAKQMTDRMLQDDYEAEVTKIEALIGKAIKSHKYCIKTTWDLSTKMKDKLRELGYNVMGREVSWYKPGSELSIAGSYIQKGDCTYTPVYDSWTPNTVVYNESRGWEGNPYH